MSGIYPNAAASASNFSINDPVMQSVNSKEMAKQIGRVVDLDIKANRVWVQFPIGYRVSIDPTELIYATEAMGKCVVDPVDIKDTMYYKFSRLAESVAASKANIDKEEYRSSKMAHSIAERFASEKIDRLHKDAIARKVEGKSEMVAYGELFSKYSSPCSDDLIRGAVEKAYGDK